MDQHYVDPTKEQFALFKNMQRAYARERGAGPARASLYLDNETFS